MLTASLRSGLTTELAEYEGLKEAATAGGLAGKVTQDAVAGGTVQAGVGTITVRFCTPAILSSTRASGRFCFCPRMSK